jgi:hypothetical protein
MAKCHSCNGVITKADVACYLCGDKIPGRSKFSLARFFGKSKATDEKNHRAVQRVMMRDALRPSNTDVSRSL